MELSYCTNVHPAEDLDGIIDQLDLHAGPIRAAAGLASLGVGLWMPEQAASVLARDAAARDRLAAALERNGLVLRTVNAFPYTGFHQDVVKLGVYSPDWTTSERLRYTKDVASALAALLPEGAEGSISTLPLGWREGWDDASDAAAGRALGELRDHLRALEAQTGRVIRIGIEPEPGCILDDVADIVRWLSARPALLEGGYLGVCLDTCHLAVSFADPVATVASVAAAGIPIVKVQASAALEVVDPAGAAAPGAIAPFAEAKYLHQVRTIVDGERLAADDLVDVIADEQWPTQSPWRVHVHVPLHARLAAPLRATTEVLLEAVDAVLRVPGGDRAHLDVETYTWTVLPPDLQPADLVSGIAEELRWAVQHLPVQRPARAEALR